MFETAKRLIDEYCMEEFNSPADYDDLTQIGIGYTIIDGITEEHEIQIYANLIDFAIETYVDGICIRSHHFGTLEDMITYGLSDLCFEYLIWLSDEELELIERS
jgi:hypothetical protein